MSTTRNIEKDYTPVVVPLVSVLLVVCMQCKIDFVSVSSVEELYHLSS